MDVQVNENIAIAGAVIGGGAVDGQLHRSLGSSKPPPFEGTFELYKVELELYMTDRVAWIVVTATEVRHVTDQDQQAIFDRRVRLARDTILRGLRGCKNDDASNLWDTLVLSYTQRAFSYAMLLKRQPFRCSHALGQSMTDYIRPITQLRHRLLIMNTEHASGWRFGWILLMGVAMTYRELLEHFDLPTNQGNPPKIQQVTNALRSQDERDRMVAQGGRSAGVVMSMTGSDGEYLSK
ncbi:Hypothetical protein PHPALM_3359 [Phytophthora palmivora]|uniref:Uncharacterized protein n=1 Tax=Phytophthora palmivora TaxID=4796 RepID=A0A2P4YMN2_9STRA|nr:Hypothetical protein PHPALM_3359 [Phytophthora palmivora]